MAAAPEGDATGGSKHFISSSSAVCLCLISLTSPAKSLRRTSVLNEEEEREKKNMVHFYLDPNNGADQTGWGYEKDL